MRKETVAAQRDDKGESAELTAAELEAGRSQAAEMGMARVGTERALEVEAEPAPALTCEKRVDSLAVRLEPAQSSGIEVLEAAECEAELSA